MPAKNKIKQYLENGFYHIYNRGVEKRDIFKDEQDYKVFLSYLKNYLESISEKELKKALIDASFSEKDKILTKISLSNFSNEINLLAFCLMPNHFHLLIKQRSERGIESFMQSLGTRYVMYFNKRNKRVGGLFQGTYKAVLVETDEQLLHLSRYIHANPSDMGVSLVEYPYSSLKAYMGSWKADWLKPQEILDFFSKTNENNSYRSFVLEKDIGEKAAYLINDLTLD